MGPLSRRYGTTLLLGVYNHDQMGSSSDGSSGVVVMCLGAFVICKYFLAVPIIRKYTGYKTKF